jgi:signal transduction histidine kinase
MDHFFGATTDEVTSQELALAVQEQRNSNVTLHKVLPNGQQQVTELSLSPVNSDKGQLTHFVGIVSDVSARVQAEEAMAQRRAQLDAIFSLSPDGFVLFDSDNRMVFANPAFERMTGLSWTGQGQPVSLDDFETVMSEVCDANQPFPSISTSTAEGAPWQARLHLIRPQIRVVQAQARTNNAGSRETILYFRDVTHEDAVDRMKSEFLAAAAHELRTPMVSIFGFTELLLRRKFSEERKTDMLETIHRQSGLLVKMINELLDLARIESRGGLDLKIEAHSLVELVNNSVKGLMLKDTDRQVKIGEVPQVNVQIDPEKMQLAMNNLLSNAFKYSPQGGTVSVAARLSAGNGERFAIIEVRDQGIGMTPEQLARVFERFYRADASGNIPGTGLGLSMVKEVAGLHKGRIEITSEYGKGTMASLWIPLAKTPMAIAATVDTASTS